MILFISYLSVKLIPNVYEMVWTYTKKSEEELMPWPTWVAYITNVR